MLSLVNVKLYELDKNEAIKKLLDTEIVIDIHPKFKNNLRDAGLVEYVFESVIEYNQHIRKECVSKRMLMEILWVDSKFVGPRQYIVYDHASNFEYRLVSDAIQMGGDRFRFR